MKEHLNIFVESENKHLLKYVCLALGAIFAQRHATVKIDGVGVVFTPGALEDALAFIGQELLYGTVVIGRAPLEPEGENHIKRMKDPRGDMGVEYAAFRQTFPEGASDIQITLQKMLLESAVWKLHTACSEHHAEDDDLEFFHYSPDDAIAKEGSEASMVDFMTRNEVTVALTAVLIKHE